MNDLERFRRSLDLEGNVLEVVGSVTAPATRPHGFTSVGASSAAAIEDALREPNWEAAEVGDPEAPEARWWCGGPHHVLVVEVEAGEPVVAEDAVRLDDGRIVLGFGGGAGAVRLHGQTGDWVVANDDGRASVYRLTPAWMGEPIATPVARTTLEAPAMTTLRSYQDASPWLRSIVDELITAHSPSTIATAVGMLARLSLPASLETAGLGTQELVDWCRSLQAAQLDDLEDLAIEEVSALSETLEVVGPLTEPEALGAIANDLVIRRDELESRLVVLRVTGRGLELAESLDAFDREATNRIGWLSQGVVVDERLEAVSWCEPDAWWGSLAVDE